MLQKNIGLKSSEIPELREKYGANKLPAPRSVGVLIFFLRQFLSPFIYILILAAVVSFSIGQNASGIFILIVLFINATVGTVQEFSAQKSAAALRDMVKGTARVIRDGKLCEISSEDVLPGDFITLASGDKVPADITLSLTREFFVDESALTGESLPVSKDADALVPENAGISDKVNCCFAGTIITNGRGEGTVTAIALDTELGTISTHISSGEFGKPPLMIRIHRFTLQLSFGILLAIAALVGIMAFSGDYTIESMLLVSIGLAVSVIPEGLPAALTVSLAIGMRRMADKNVIIRKLVAVEALGSCTMICSDKTGTLTKNELTVTQIILPDGDRYEITENGIVEKDAENTEFEHEHLARICIAAILANEGHLDYLGKEWTFEGDAVDTAFLVLAKKLKISISATHEKYPQKILVPYESHMAFSGSVNEKPEGDGCCLNTKGSPERILEFCSQQWSKSGILPLNKEKNLSDAEELASLGYRVIALAMQDNVALAEKEDKLATLLPCSMTFLGLAAIIDPIRSEVKIAIQSCKEGGIGIAMITGDHPRTAEAIALDLELCQRGTPIVTGSQLRETEKKGSQAVKDLVLSSRVFARIEPDQKRQIVTVFREAGEFVAVTGDGVNDAPAMHAANVGIAMGKRGTDITKETADLIITDDNFASIVSGVEQGRIVYNNIRKVIALLTATGFSCLLMFFLTIFAGLPMPLTAIQLLWLNLVANGLQDVALAFEPGERNELKHPPRNPSEPIFEHKIIEHVLVAGTLMGVLAFAAYWFLDSIGYNETEARNLLLMLMVLFGNIHSLSSRSETRSIFQIRFFANPFLIIAVPLAQLIHIGATYTPGIREVLQIQPITLHQWGGLFLISLCLLMTEELHKWYHRKKSH
jgi:calcium-translocating P-type ATPase